MSVNERKCKVEGNKNTSSLLNIYSPKLGRRWREKWKEELKVDIPFSYIFFPSYISYQTSENETSLFPCSTKQPRENHFPPPGDGKLNTLIFNPSYFLPLNQTDQKCLTSQVEASCRSTFIANPHLNNNQDADYQP